MSTQITESVKPSPTPTRLLFHYGWINLVLASLAMIATFPGRTIGLSMINKPLQQDLHIGNVFQGSLNFWSVLLGAAFCWPVGRLLDRFGTRLVLTGIVAALGATVLWMSTVQQPEELFLSLTLTRGLGQGALSLVSLALVGKWFRRRIEPAMGIFSVLLAIGFIAVTVGLGEAVKEHGWRAPWADLGWFLLAGLAPLCLLFVRSRPEDGWSDPNEFPAEVAVSTLVADATLGAALRSPAFWVLTLAASLFNMIFSGFTFFAETILDEHGFNHDTFTLMMAMLALSGIAFNLLGGWLSRFWSLGKLLAVGMVLLALALAAFPLIHGQPGSADRSPLAALVIDGLILGGAGGVITVVFFAMYNRMFGRRHLGQIQGAAQVLSVFASAAGPLLLAWCREHTGSHHVMFMTTAALSCLCAIACWLVPLPTHFRSRLLAPIEEEPAVEESGAGSTNIQGAPDRQAGKPDLLEHPS